MSTLVVPRVVRRPAVPHAVVVSIVSWLAAILAGMAETLVRLAVAEPPTGGEVAARAGIYLVLAALVLLLRTGHDPIRWTVVLVLGVLGSLSLVVEPVRALLGGASAATFLVTASLPELAAAGLRALHLVEVLVALVLLFHPSATAFFRMSRTERRSSQV
ncbi:hypothetical protein WIS52_05635 [Pseudonocardia nematodicida]|uniref:Uncharacterized protein n=1 Tax=Pseudonocardia nematodicida TaxID=1206997 RepID=A0ABV1K649_9PSEU